MEENLSQKVLEQIEEKKIKPKSKWEFLLKDYLIWFLFVLSLVIGSAAFSVVLFALNFDNSRMLLAKTNWFTSFMLVLPYFWLIILVIFISISYYNFKNTKTGYQYSPYLVVLLSIMISLIVGGIIYETGGAEKIEQICYEKMPVYKTLIRHQGKIFIAPQEGRLAGVIIIVHPQKTNFELKDFQNNTWQIQLPQDRTPPPVLVKEGMRVKILGEIIEQDQFLAEQIIPWFRKNSLFMHQQTRNGLASPACPACERN